MAKAPKKHATAQPEDLPEAKTGKSAKTKAAAKVFKDADEAVALPPGQLDANLRRVALGF